MHGPARKENHVYEIAALKRRTFIYTDVKIDSNYSNTDEFVISICA